MLLKPEKGRDVAFTIMHSVNSGIKGSNHYSFVSLCSGVMYLFNVTAWLLQDVSDKPLSDSNRRFVSTIKNSSHHHKRPWYFTAGLFWHIHNPTNSDFFSSFFCNSCLCMGQPCSAALNLVFKSDYLPLCHWLSRRQKNKGPHTRKTHSKQWKQWLNSVSSCLLPLGQKWMWRSKF